MLRTTLSALVALAALAGSQQAGAAPTTVTDTPTADDVTVVAEAVLAPSQFELVARPMAASTTAKAGALAAGCADRTYALAKWRVSGTYGWYYNGKGAPRSVAGTALRTLRDSTWRLFHATYRCGGSTNLTVGERYSGGTTRAAQISATGACTGNDGYSITSWGRLPRSTLAYTCVYYRSGTKIVLSADTLIDNTAHNWFTTLPRGCRNSFDLFSVMVHERGHAVGLAHVDQRAHGSQAMSPKTMPCTTVDRTLGGGDVRGLKARYGR